jgi:hypothetical protein
MLQRMAAWSAQPPVGLDKNLWPEHVGQIRSFLSLPPALPRIKDLAGTKTHDKTFAVLGGFWHDAA